MGRSKRGGIFGMLQGSVGPATYSIGLNGAGKKQQIVREKPVEVANPRTRAQAIQRMKLVPIQFAMNILSDIVDHSFRGVTEGWPSKRHFLALAMRELDIPFIKKGSLDRAIGGYQISAGTLGNTRAVLQTVQNIGLSQYGLKYPVAQNFFIKTDLVFGGKSWAACSQSLLQFNPNLQNGDEIAVLNFIIANNGSTKGVRLVKRRMLIDTQFTTDTPAEYKKTVGEGEEAVEYDLNVLYAFDQYNDTNSVDSDLISNDSLITMRPDYVGSMLFFYLMGLLPSSDQLTGVVLNKIYEEGDTIENFNLDAVPQYAATAVNGKLAASALIISRIVNGSWDYTTSDICLTPGYLDAVNTNALMEAAITSYMTETAIDTSSSEYYLQLTEEQAENYAASSIAVTGTIEVGGSQTAVKASIDCRVNPMTGKNIVFVNTDGYCIGLGGGTSADSSESLLGFRWRKAADNTYVTPTAYVKGSEIADTSNIEFATLV